MKKNLTYLIGIFMFMLIFSVGADAGNFSAADILPSTAKGITGSGSIGDVAYTGTTSTLDTLLNFVKESIFGLLALVAIGMFLYVGFSLVKAEGNPEELKKAFMTLIHVIVGLFIVAVSWAVISMVSSFTF